MRRGSLGSNPADGQQNQGFFSVLKLQRLRDLIILKRPDVHGPQLERDRLEADVLRRMARFGVYVANAPLAILVQRALEDGGNHQDHGSLCNRALTKGRGGDLGAPIPLQPPA